LIKKEDDGSSFKVDASGSGQRIDKFLSGRIKNISRSYIQNIIDQQKIKVNGEAVSKHYRLSKGDVITIKDLVKTTGAEIEPEKISLNIVYEDESLAVISKKAGIITHPTPQSKNHTLVNALLYHYRKLSKLSGRDRAGIVHRLDKNTSGLLVVAKDDATHSLLSDMFRKRLVKKTYAALVWGSFPGKKGEIILPIGRSGLDRKKMSISIDRGREAVTKFEVVEEFGDSTLLNIHPETGRTHQIRVHLSYIGHPVIGDEVYGTKQSQKLARDLGLDRQFLHAKRLEFAHPVTKKQLKIEDKLAGDLQKCLKNLRRREKMSQN
jgi:23S rRNA pseudouridine1911/1915/1917 synthase